MAALPETGITTSMVGNALGTTSRDVGTLCKHSSINKWAKYKPIAYNTTSPLTEAQRKEKNYGIEAWSGSSPNQVIIFHLFTDGSTSITYNAPSGGTVSPYRLGDFRKYNHDATAPIQNFFKSGQNWTTTTSWQDIQPIEGIGADETILTKQEVYYCTDADGNVEPLEYCIAIKSGTTSTETPQWSVGGIPWGDTNWNKYKGKTCHVYEMLCNLPSGTTSSKHIANTTDKFFALPECYHTVTFKSPSTGGSSSSEFNLSGIFTVTGLSVSGTVTVNATDTSTTSYTGGTITYMIAELLETSASTRNIGSRIIVASGSSVNVGAEAIKTYQATIIPDATVTQPWVKVTCKTTKSTLTHLSQCRIPIDVGDKV